MYTTPSASGPVEQVQSEPKSGDPQSSNPPSCECQKTTEDLESENRVLKEEKEVLQLENHRLTEHVQRLRLEALRSHELEKQLEEVKAQLRNAQRPGGPKFGESTYPTPFGKYVGKGKMAFGAVLESKQ
jgi:predicted RNase H-like nuclease (RuvC/YqgF family)